MNRDERHRFLRYGFQLGVSEEVTESVLTGCLEAHGGAVTRSTRLLGLEPGEDAVTATLERAGERPARLAEATAAPARHAARRAVWAPRGCAHQCQPGDAETAVSTYDYGRHLTPLSAVFFPSARHP